MSAILAHLNRSRCGNSLLVKLGKTPAHRRFSLSLSVLMSSIRSPGSMTILLLVFQNALGPHLQQASIRVLGAPCHRHFLMVPLLRYFKENSTSPWSWGQKHWRLFDDSKKMISGQTGHTHLLRNNRFQWISLTIPLKYRTQSFRRISPLLSLTMPDELTSSTRPQSMQPN
ncbi:unannotated protein [freshwater metagenome]|uniref:Unannotated protein n=1 Tax=freshwater metagenome TaxID=449393 RepID=A0A6J7A4V5_9ZZZZ